MIEKLLSSLNFSAKESLVYLSLLKIGTAKPATIAGETGLNRATVYDVLESLIQKGVISKYKKGASTFFQTLDPQKLIDYIDHEKTESEKKFAEKKQEILAALPEFISLQGFATLRPKVQFFEGEKGIREAYDDSLTAKDRIFAYTNVEAMFKALPHFFPDYFERRTKSKIPAWAILVQNDAGFERAKHDVEELRQTKFFPDPKVSWSPEVKIYDNKVLISSWQEKMAVIIESKEFADLQKIIFHKLWETI